MPSAISYSSKRPSAIALLRESWQLYRSYGRNIPQRAQDLIADARRVETLIVQRLGAKLNNLDILEIGPGQFLSQMRYFALSNRVVGIDLEVIAEGINPLPYLIMLQRNGFTRTAKTVIRKLLGVDRKFAIELQRQMGSTCSLKLDVRQMDACQMSFPNDSFDFVYARSVFHHLPDPSAALDGIVRVLRPGGCAYILLHLYTSETGCLDPRVYTDRRNEVLGWPHLRPHLQKTLDNQNVYLNKLRLHEWQALFDAKLPDAQYITTLGDSSALKAAESLHAQGELLDYSIEELTTVDMAVLWRKPAAPVAPTFQAVNREQVTVLS